MNLGAHMVMADQLVAGDPAFALGAALPDVASMVRLRLLGNTDDRRVEAGIAFHHRTDEAFHHHPWFVGHQQWLGERLAATGLGRGAVRAVAHVGPELLLDGWVANHHRRPIHDAWSEIDQRQPALISLVPPPDRARWSRHLDQVQTWDPTADDHSAAGVARRLHRILGRRPRLAFDAAHLDAITDLLTQRAPVIEAGAADLLEDLATRLGR